MAEAIPITIMSVPTGAKPFEIALSIIWFEPDFIRAPGITNSNLSKTIANLFLLLKKHPYPSCQFTCETEAGESIKQYLHSPNTHTQ